MRRTSLHMDRYTRLTKAMTDLAKFALNFQQALNEVQHQASVAVRKNARE